MTVSSIWRQCLICAFLFVLGHPVLAQEGAETTDGTGFAVHRMAVVNLDKLLRDSTATTRVRELLDKKREEFQAEFAEKEIDLIAKERELNAKRELISDTAFQEEVRAFQAEVGQVQQDIQLKRQSLDKALQQAQDEIRQLALTIIAEVAQEFNLDVVMNAEQILIFKNQLDLTSIILEKLNERTKNARLETNKE